MKGRRKIFFAAFRQLLYFTVMLGFVFFVHFLSYHFRISTFSEYGIIENIQFGMLVCSGIFFMTEGIYFKNYRELLFLLASFCAVASCREMDNYFDKHLPIISWRIGFIFLLAALFLSYLNRHKLTRQLVSFGTSPAFYMMCMAMIVIIPIAQCVGHRPFVVAVLGENQVREIKEFIEESCECIGYLLILLSTCEIYFDILRTKYKSHKL